MASRTFRIIVLTIATIIGLPQAAIMLFGALFSGLETIGMAISLLAPCVIGIAPLLAFWRPLPVAKRALAAWTIYFVNDCIMTGSFAHAITGDNAIGQGTFIILLLILAAALSEFLQRRNEKVRLHDPLSEETATGESEHSAGL